MTFQHCLAFDKFDSNTKMNLYYYYAFVKKEIAFKLLDKMIKNSNTFLMLVSTKDPHNY